MYYYSTIRYWPWSTRAELTQKKQMNTQKLINHIYGVQPACDRLARDWHKPCGRMAIIKQSVEKSGPRRYRYDASEVPWYDESRRKVWHYRIGTHINKQILIPPVLNQEPTRYLDQSPPKI